MKKLINLIALVMLVSTNVLTPFTYAGDEIVENETENVGEVTEISEDDAETPEYKEEIPENITDDSGEAEQDLQADDEQESDSLEYQDDENASNVFVDITESELEKESENQDEGESEENLELEKNQEPIVMDVVPNTSVTLLPGTSFNETIKRLAGQSGAGHGTTNTTINQIVQWSQNVIPSLITTGVISESDSEYPVYAWFTGGTLYYYTQAEKIYMNPDSNYMFAGMKGLIELNLSRFDSSNVENMLHMFSQTDLQEINLSGWNFTSMSTMENWADKSNLYTQKINLTNAKFSGDLSYMFNRQEKIEEIILDGVDTTNVTNMSYMFHACSSLIKLDLSSFDTSNVTNMNTMFGYCTGLENLNLNNWDFSNNPNRGGMFLGLNSLKTLSAKNWIIPETFNSAFGCTNAMLCAENITIDVSNWDLSKAKNLKQLFFISYAKEIKGLDTWDTSSITNMNGMFQRSSITKLDLSNWNTSNVTDMSQMFYECRDLEEIDVSTWNTSKVTNMYEMFRDCDKLEELDLRHFDVSNVTNMCEMFQDCNNLKILNLEGRDVGNMTRGNIGNIIHYCNNLEELNLSGWDFRNIRGDNLFSNNLSSYQLAKLKKLNLTNTKFSGSMERSFSGIPNIEEIKFEGIDTSNVTYMKNMFMGCRKLTGLDLSSLNTSNVTGMSEMFYGCTELVNLNLSGWDFKKTNAYDLANNLDLYQTSLKVLNMTNTSFSGSMHNAFQGLGSKNVNLILDNIDTSNVTAMSSMFKGCSGLTGLNLSNFDTSNVTAMDTMFFGCSGLQSLNLTNFDTSKVTSMSAMFYNCGNLTGLDLSNFDTSNVTSMNAIFYGCNKLKELNLSGWDFRNISIMRYNGPFGIGFASNLKNLNMKNTKFSGSMESTFNGLTSLQEIDLEGADTSNVVNMKAMFNGCSSLTGLNLSNWNTSNVTGMEVMFSGCNKLESLKLDNWDLSKNPNMGGFISKTPSLKSISMSGWTIPASFANVVGRIWGNPNNSLEYIDVTNWDLRETNDIGGLFADSRNLKNIKGLDTWNTSTVTNMSNMFNGCSSLTGLDLSNWDTSNVAGMQAMFAGSNKLENLNLDNWVISGSSSTIASMFGGANNLKTVSMRNWTIPESFTSAIGCRTSSLCATGIESIDVSNWNLSGTKNLDGLFGGSYAKEIKGLDTWDTSSVEIMSNMFYQCRNLQELNINNWDTSNVTNMSSMFNGCSNLTGLDLSNWDLSNITEMNSMFVGCTGLENLNLDNWNLSNNPSMGSLISNTPSLKYISMSGWIIPENFQDKIGRNWGYPNNTIEKINVNNWDLSKTKYIQGLFGDIKNLKTIEGLESWDTSNIENMNQLFFSCGGLTGLNLSNFDTSNVTNMGVMFYGCTSLINLDLSRFDTSKVQDMNVMFYNTPNLKTIYASEKFVTTALSGDNSSKDMFSGTTSVVGGNGTKFDPNYIDKTYAKIDKVGQTGYFTDKNAINVKFINTLDGTETTSTFARGQKLTPPYVDKYHVVGGYLDEAMTQKIDLNKGVDSYSEIYVKYERNGSSGGGGGGGGGSTKPDTPEDEQQPAEPSQSDASSGTNVKEPETNTGSNIQTGSQVDPSEQTTQNNESNTQDSSTSSQNDEKIYSTEFQEAYEFAKGNGITTMPTIQKANMEGKLTRIAMAKMLSQYAINVLGKTPDTSKTVKFKDVTSKKDADYDNGVTLAYQLGIMGQNMPGNNFRPNDEVTRGEFATALSRMTYNTSDGEYKSTSKYYVHHMEKLVNEGIITNDNPNMKELRGYVMIMLMRSAK